MKVNLIEVNVVVVNMFSRNMVGITTLKKSQTLPKFFLNLVHVQTTINFLSEWKPLICPCSQKLAWLGWISKNGYKAPVVEQKVKVRQINTLQSLKVFEVLLCRCLYIMGYSWECGRLLFRICHNDFWFCGILTDKLVSKIFWRHWFLTFKSP